MSQFYTEIECGILGETNAAYLITHDGVKKTWIPKSQILDDDIPSQDRQGTGEIFHIQIPEWLATAKGLV